ncbi:MAG: histidine phosphatase family protein [Armatimonadota bacterium]
MGVEAVQTRLLLMRHGEVDWSGAIDGEPPLSAAGLTAAELTASRLPRFDHIAASAQRPARETAEAVGAVRALPVRWRDDLDEIRTASLISDAGGYAAWLDRLFESPVTAPDGESLTDGAHRLTVALRAIADQFYGRSTLVISHPAILLAFRAQQLQAAVSRELVETLPDMALATVDYVEGRFYLVGDFPMRWPGE